MTTAPAHRATLQAAWTQSLPVVFGYLPIGFAFGILASKAGLSPFNTLAMSLLVYAGSAQLVAVGLFAAGSAPWSIILTTLIVNLRHLLMSAALAPHLRRWRQALIALFAFELTDETFAVHSTRFAQGRSLPSEALLINAISQSAWVGGTWLGLVVGDLIHDVQPFGLDYALTAMFIALLVFQLTERIRVAIALLAGIMSTGLLLAGVSQWNVMIATIISATIGVWIESWTRARSS